MIKALAFTALLAACGNPPTKTDPTTPTGPTTADTTTVEVPKEPPKEPVKPVDTCTPRMQALEARMSALAQVTPGLMPQTPATLKAATAKAGKPVDGPGIALVITADGKVVIQGSTLSMADGTAYLDSRYKTALEAAAMDKGPKPPWKLYILADQSVKIATIANLVGDMAPKFEVRLLASGTPNPMTDELLAKPSVKPLVASVPATEPEATTALVDAFKKAVLPGCDGIMTAIAANAMIDGGPIREPELRATLVPAAATKCGCKLADVDVFEYTLLRLSGAYQDRFDYVALPKLDKKDKRTVKAVVGG